MSLFELNKIAGAILFAGVVTTVSWIIAANVYHVDSSHGSLAYALPVAEEEEEAIEAEDAAAEEAAEEAVAAVEAAEESVTETADDALLAGADAAKGKKTYKKCAACHTVDEGGKSKVGPNLWNIVGREIAAIEGFKYSDAMASKGGSWSLAALNQYLTNPKEDVPGTKMAFKGIKKDGDRANLLLYLQSLGE
ncbi:MAG: cytochrome c family protein [Alphaproteobacteria bacterium]|nr:cytochrome c family protein [Alphaproteobacteria bacterium]